MYAIGTILKATGRLPLTVVRSAGGTVNDRLIISEIPLRLFNNRLNL